MSVDERERERVIAFIVSHRLQIHFIDKIRQYSKGAETTYDIGDVWDEYVSPGRHKIMIC